MSTTMQPVEWMCEIHANVSEARTQVHRVIALPKTFL